MTIEIRRPIWQSVLCISVKRQLALADAAARISYCRETIFKSYACSLENSALGRVLQSFALSCNTTRVQDSKGRTGGTCQVFSPAPQHTHVWKLSNLIQLVFCPVGPSLVPSSCKCARPLADRNCTHAYILVSFCFTGHMHRDMHTPWARQHIA